MITLAVACTLTSALATNGQVPAKASFSGTAQVWFVTMDSCKLSVPSAQYQIVDSQTPQFRKLFTAATGPRNQDGSGSCPIPRGTCQISPNTGCAEVDLPYPNTYTMHEVATPPADSSNPQGYAPCTGGSACQSESSTITISSSGAVTATTTNIYPDGKAAVYPSTTTTFNGSITDPIVWHNFGLGTGSCDSDNDADDHLTGSPSSHCAFPEAQEDTVTTCGGSIYPWSCTMYVIGSGAGPGPATHISLSATTGITQAAGVSFSVKLTALDSKNTTATAYSGNKTLSWSGPSKAPGGKSPTYPKNPVSFINGIANTTLTLYDAQSLTLGVSDGSISGSLPGMSVAAGPATQLALSKPGTVTAGTAFSETITAKDAYSNVALTYAGGKTLSWSGAGAAPNNGPAPRFPPNPVQFFNGIVKVSVSLYDAVSTNLSVTDGTFTATSGSFSVNSSSTGHFTLSLPPSATAGASIGSISLVAQDQYNNTTTGYTGSHFIKWSGASTAPGGQTPVYPTTNVTFANGVSTTTLSSTLFAAGSNVITATASSPTLVGSSSIGILPAAATHFAVPAPTTVAGAPFGETITALDQYNNVAAYNGAKTLTWSGPGTSLSGTAPSYQSNPVTFSNGIGTAATTLYKAETTTLTVGDGTISSSSQSFTVQPATLSQFALSTPSSSITAGVAASITLIAQDAYGNRNFPSYAGSKTLTFSGPANSPNGTQPVYPTSPVTFTWDGTKNIATTSITLFDAEGVSLTAGDGTGVFGSLLGLIVLPTGAAYLDVGAPGPVAPATAAPVAGVQFNETVRIADQYGNSATNVPTSGSFSWTGPTTTAPDGTHQATYPPNPVPISDSAATVPITLVMAETTSLTVSMGSLTGTSAPFTVASGPAASFSVNAPTTATSGTPFNVTLSTLDGDGNATGYGGAGNLTWSGPSPAPDGTQPTYPPNPVTFTAGVATVSVTLYNYETTSLTVGDGVIQGTSGTIAVIPGSSTRFTITNAGIVTAGSPFNATVTAVDPHGNAIPSYTGGHALNWSGTGNGPDGSPPSLPPNPVLFSGGRATVQLALTRAGTTTLGVSDGSLGGSLMFQVVPGATTALALSDPGAVTAGTPFTETVTAVDAHGNTTPAYGGSQALTFSGPGNADDGTPPAYPTNPVTFVGGVAAVQVTLYRAAPTTLGVTDGLYSGSVPITVSPGSAASLAMSNPGTQTAGSPFSVTLTAFDSHGNVATGYSPAQPLQWSGAHTAPDGTDQPAYPGSVTFASGVASAQITLYDAETIASLSASDGTLTATSGPVTVNPGSTQTLTLSGVPSSASIGQQITAGITALDPYQNISTADNSTLTVSTSDPLSTWPTSTGVTLSQGQAQMSGAYATPGQQSVTVAEGGISATAFTQVGL